MKSLFSSLFFLGTILFMPMTSPAWECNVTLDAPKTIKLDQTITLTADGTPTGGSYSWSRTPNLTPAGNTAVLIGHKPSYSEYIQVIAYYKTPKGKTCKDVQWIWACVCNVTTLNGPAMAKIGQPVILTAEAEPTGGAYTWTIESGTGTLTPADSSAEFIGDQAGPVEIKVSYVPPDGGKPCVKYHTIEVVGECEVTLTGELYQRPICRDVNFSAEVYPAGGTCSWTARNGISGSNCNAVYSGTLAINDTVTVTYTSPDGTTCFDSENILSYSLDVMVPNKNCFELGQTLQNSDFDFSISPQGFTFQPILSPQTVTTDPLQTQMRVTAYPVLCGPGSANEVSTVIEVINTEKKLTAGISVEIPNNLTEPLKKFGLAEELKFELRHSYKKYSECCTDGPIKSTIGETSLRVSADFKGKTIFGAPIPPTVKKYVTLDWLQLSLTCMADLEVQGEFKGCKNLEEWSGGGTVTVQLDLAAEAISKIPGEYLVLEGKMEVRTDIKETLKAHGKQLDISGEWGGIVAAMKIKVKVYGKNIFPSAFINYPLLTGKTIPQYSVPLPTLK